jgi:tetratricopeptide (TPR) repeat protein
MPRNLAEIIGRHLAAAGMLMDDDPELALQHARYARSKAARVALVREAVGLTAYYAGEWAEALSELRAARRMAGGPGHVAIMADCERALGRPERALEAVRESQLLDLPHDEAIELKIVEAGARRDLGQIDASVVTLQVPELDPNAGEPWTARLCYAYADNLAAAGRAEEAIRWFLNAAQADDDGETDAAERAIELSDPEAYQRMLESLEEQSEQDEPPTETPTAAEDATPGESEADESEQDEPVADQTVPGEPDAEEASEPVGERS